MSNSNEETNEVSDVADDDGDQEIGTFETIGNLAADVVLLLQARKKAPEAGESNLWGQHAQRTIAGRSDATGVVRSNENRGGPQDVRRPLGGRTI